MGYRRTRTIKNIQASYYKGANGILVVYDITNKESFEHLNNWLIEIEKKGVKMCINY